MDSELGVLSHGAPLHNTGGTERGMGLVLAASVASALLGAEPLLYVGAWLMFPGRWVAYFPQSFEVVRYVTAAGAVLGLATVTMAIWGSPVDSSTGLWRLAKFWTVLLAATGIGCAAGWWTYMATWHV